MCLLFFYKSFLLKKFILKIHNVRTMACIVRLINLQADLCKEIELFLKEEGCKLLQKMDKNVQKSNENYRIWINNCIGSLLTCRITLSTWN